MTVPLKCHMNDTFKVPYEWYIRPSEGIIKIDKKIIENLVILHIDISISMWYNIVKIKDRGKRKKPRTYLGGTL